MTGFARMPTAFVLFAVVALVHPAGADIISPGGEGRSDRWRKERKIVDPPFDPAASSKVDPEFEKQLKKRQQDESDTQRALLDAEDRRQARRADEKRRLLAFGAGVAALGVMAAARFRKAKR